MEKTQRIPRKPKTDAYRDKKLSVRITQSEKNMYEQVRILLSNERGKALSLADMVTILTTEKLQQAQNIHPQNS